MLIRLTFAKKNEVQWGKPWTYAMPINHSKRRKKRHQSAILLKPSPEDPDRTLQSTGWERMNFLIALLVFQRINRKRHVTVPATEPPFSICTVAKRLSTSRWGEKPILREACSQVYPESAICVQRFDDSLNSAIRITYRISLRSSSLREPRYPLLRVVFWLPMSQILRWSSRGRTIQT